MLLGVEMVAAETFPIALGHFFETWLAVGEQTVHRSLGRDEYHLPVEIRPPGRLAATGRIHLCQVDTEQIGLGPMQAPPARTTVVPAVPDQQASHAGSPSDAPPLVLHIRTNTRLKLDDLRRAVTLRLVGPAGIVNQMPAGRLPAYQIDDGRFLFALAPLLATPPEQGSTNS